jgi:DNA-binding transcriptional regulator PaaX
MLCKCSESGGVKSEMEGQKFYFILNYKVNNKFREKIKRLYENFKEFKWEFLVKHGYSSGECPTKSKFKCY